MTSCRPWFRGTLLVGLFLYGLFAVTVILPVFRRVLGRRAQGACERVVMNWNRAACRILHIRLKVTGLPDASAGMTVANHVSWLDIIALGSLQPFLFVAKEEVAQWPVMGVLARGIGTLFIRRGDAEQSTAVGETMAWLLRRGVRLLVFPEGTTTRGDQVLRFHGKLFLPAQRSHVGVQAVALKYGGLASHHAPFVGDDDFVPHLLRILRLETIDLHAHFCPALPAGLRRDQLARATRLQVTERLYLPSRRSLTPLLSVIKN
jgi:1-acyl-sn-glycerol-3-phosphate acyltransferase